MRLKLQLRSAVFAAIHPLEARDIFLFWMKKAGMIYHPQQQLIYGGLKEERIEDILASKGISGDRGR